MTRPVHVVGALLLLGVVGLAVWPTLGAPSATERIAAARARYETLRVACEKFHAATGRYAREYADHPAEFRDLSTARPDVPGSPFLPEPLHAWDATIAARLFVLNAADHSPAREGFDLDGDGRVDVSGPCNVLRFDYAEEFWSRDFDALIDAGVPGDWKKTGRGRFLGEIAGKPGHYELLLLK
jgi:hypothetical protein